MRKHDISFRFSEGKNERQFDGFGGGGIGKYTTNIKYVENSIILGQSQGGEEKRRMRRKP